MDTRIQRGGPYQEDHNLG
ncbi:hypothetical protein LINPERHAP1_LOCUS29131 [Linum perenne]